MATILDEPRVTERKWSPPPMPALPDVVEAPRESYLRRAIEYNLGILRRLSRGDCP